MSDNKKVFDDEEDFFSSSSISAFDSRLRKRAARPTLVSKIKHDNKKHAENKKFNSMSFATELKRYWYIYAILAVSSLFTGTLGIYMGLAPYDEGNGIIYFNTDPVHIALAVVYFVAFITVTEGAFALGKRLFFIREEENGTQKKTSLFIMIVSGLSILGTGISGGEVIASNISILTAFVEIPEGAQKWVVMIIPVLLSAYTFALASYQLSSDEAASERIIMQAENDYAIDHRTRTKMTERFAIEKLQERQLNVYIKAVDSGKISYEQAMEAMRKGISLVQLEKILGIDIDGDGHVGSVVMAEDVREVQLPKS